MLLRWALAFFVIAILSALLGFGRIAGTASGVASALFWVFIALFILALLANLITGNRTRLP